MRNYIRDYTRAREIELTQINDWIKRNPLLDCRLGNKAKVSPKACAAIACKASYHPANLRSCYGCPNSDLPDKYPTYGICVVCGEELKINPSDKGRHDGGYLCREHKYSYRPKYTYNRPKLTPLAEVRRKYLEGLLEGTDDFEDRGSMPWD